jgi:hypothetical protein
MKIFNKILETLTNTNNKTADASANQPESAPSAVAKTDSEPKPKKPRNKKEKPVKVEPRVSVLGFDFDPKNPSMGSMELDWNNEFIEMLRANGYRGINPEDLVDAWLNDVARNIIRTNEQNPPNLENSRYVTRTNLGDGRTEIK